MVTVATKVEKRTPSRRPGWKVIAMLAVIAAGCLAIWFFFLRAPSLPPVPLEGVPEGTPALMQIDVDAILESTLYRRFIREQDRDAGLQRIEQRCGFNPLRQFERVIVYVTGEVPRSLDHIGYAAEGPLDHDALANCVRQALESDGGGIERVEIEGVPAVAGLRGNSRIAFIGRRALIGGNEEQVRRVIHVLRGEAPSAATDQDLVALWNRISSGREISLVAKIPQTWRDAMSTRMAVFNVSEALAPITHLVSAGIGLDVRTDVDLGAVVRFDDPSSAEQVRAAIQQRIEGVLRNPLIALTAAAPVLRRIDLEARETELVVAASVREDELDSVAVLMQRVFQAPADPAVE